MFLDFTNVLLRFLTGLVMILFVCSCSSPKKAIYFNNVDEVEVPVSNFELEPMIKPNDILSISVSSLNPEASEVFNRPNLSPTTYSEITPTTTQSTGYLVSIEGFIQFPILGNIKVTGYTKKGLKDFLTKTLIDRKLLVDPVVDVRYLNFRVSVLGEVARPSVVTIPSEKVSLLEALALAGDLTIYARRDNVMIIREENGKRSVARIDLNSSTLLTSPYYYLKSNDVVYAEPNRVRVNSTRKVYLWLPVVLSVMSFGIIAVDRINR